MRRHVLTSTAALAVVLVAAASASADAPVVRSVERVVPVKQGDVTTSTVGCPRRMAALGGAVIRRPSGSTLRGSIPASGRTWRFRFGGYEGARRHSARVAVRCVRLTVPSGTLLLRTAYRTDRITVPALGTQTTTLRCPRGYLATAWGFERRPPGSSSPLGPEETHVYRAMAAANRFELGLENTGGADESVRLRIRCLQERARTESGLLEHDFDIRRGGFRRRLGSGIKALRHTCPPGHFALSAGHQINAADDVLHRSSFVRWARTGRWSFDNSLAGPSRVRVQLVCLDRRTDFRAVG